MLTCRLHAGLALCFALIVCSSALAEAPKETATYAFTCNSDPALNLAPVTYIFQIKPSPNAGSSSADGGSTTKSTLTVQFPVNKVSVNQLMALSKSKTLSTCTLTETLVDSSVGTHSIRTVFTWSFEGVNLSSVDLSGNDGSVPATGGPKVPKEYVLAVFQYSGASYTVN
jgi:hypothetical protein